MSHIYNLTSDVTVTSFQMESTPNLDIGSAWYPGTYVHSFASLSYCVLFYYPPPPPRGRRVARGPSGRRVNFRRNGKGALVKPLCFSEISKTAARSAAFSAHLFIYLFSAYVVKISDQGHSRSGHQVTRSPDHVK